jgi:hypothetical protein
MILVRNEVLTENSLRVWGLSHTLPETKNYISQNPPPRKLPVSGGGKRKAGDGTVRLVWRRDGHIRSAVSPLSPSSTYVRVPRPHKPAPRSRHLQTLGWVQRPQP